MPDHGQITQPNLYHFVFAEVFKKYTNHAPVILPNALCEGNCMVEVLGPRWDIKCSRSQEPYRLSTCEEKLASVFENETRRPDSTYSGAQEVFEGLVDYKIRRYRRVCK